MCKLGAEVAYGRTQIDTAGQDFLTRYSEEGDIFLSHVVTGARRGCRTQAAVYEVEAHFIANKDEIQADHFNSEDHVHSVLGLVSRDPE